MDKLLEAEIRTTKYAAGENIRFPDYRSEDELDRARHLVESDNFWWGLVFGSIGRKPKKFTTPTQYRLSQKMGMNHNPEGKNQF